jgi:hypothetical protein
MAILKKFLPRKAFFQSMRRSPAKSVGGKEVPRQERKTVK